MSAWNTVALGRVCKVVPGFAFKSKDWCSEGLPVLKIKNIRGDGGIDTTEVDCVPQNLMSERMKRFVLKDGDILLAMTGATAGKVGKLRDSSQYLLNQRVAKLEPIDIDPVFFWSVVSSAEYQNRFFRLADGAAQPNMSGSQIEGVPVPLPPLETQRRIASILGAYDDLIEVNRRRVALLERMARGLFDEWFVRFRFPGHEAVPIVNTPDGPLPEGWTLLSVGEASASVSRGIAPRYDEAATTMVVGQKCIRDARLNLLLARRQSKAAPPQKSIRTGDILINSTGIGTLGRVAQAEEVPDGLTADSHVTIVRPRNIDDRDYLGLSLIKLQPVFEHLGAGSTGQTELSKSSVEAQQVVWPSRELRQQFGGYVRPMRALVDELLVANVCLAASRDLLLPRLISGQLSVAAAERELEAAA